MLSLKNQRQAESGPRAEGIKSVNKYKQLPILQLFYKSLFN